jgi:hypothetical protein
MSTLQLCSHIYLGITPPDESVREEARSGSMSLEVFRGKQHCEGGIEA